MACSLSFALLLACGRLGYDPFQTTLTGEDTGPNNGSPSPPGPASRSAPLPLDEDPLDAGAPTASDSFSSDASPPTVEPTTSDPDDTPAPTGPFPNGGTAGDSTTPDTGGSAGNPSGGSGNVTPTLGGAGGSAGLGGSGGLDSSAGSGGSAGSGSSASTGNGGQGADTSSGGQAGSGSLPLSANLNQGVWLLDSTDVDGTDWSNSTFLFTRVQQNPDGTESIDARIDWFQEQLFAGTEIATGRYDPATSTLSMTQVQTGGPSGQVLDIYDASYDELTDTLVDGQWTTGVPGTFTAVRQLDGIQLTLSGAQGSSEYSTAYDGAKVLDGDLETYWSSEDNTLSGVVLTVDLATPSRILGMRLFAPRPTRFFAPPQTITITAFTQDGTELATAPVSFSDSELWQIHALDLPPSCSRLELDVTSVVDTRGSWLTIHELELFGE